MTSYQDLYPYMITRLPGCPQQVATQELHMAGRDFCSETEAWVEDLDDITVVAGQTDYTLTPSYDCLIKRVESVVVQPTGYSPSIPPAPPIDPQAYSLVNDSTLRLTLTPATGVSQILQVKLVLIPNLESNEIDELFFDRWGVRGIFPMAMYRLFAMDGQPWANEKKQRQYFLQYKDAIGKARLEKQRMNKGGDLRVIPRAFV